MFSVLTQQRVADINKGIRVNKAANTTPLASADLYHIYVGRVLMTLFIGEITTVIGAGATTIQIVSNPTVGLAINLSGAGTDLASDAVGVQMGLTGTAADNMLHGQALAPMQANAVVLSVGHLSVVYGAGTAGAIKYSLWYVPLDAGAYVAAV